MKTNVTETSMDAYYNPKRCGREGSQRRKIFDYIRTQYGCVSRQDISKALDLPINVVCGRVKQLLDEKAIRVRYTDDESTVHGPREMLSIASPQLSLLDGQQGDPMPEAPR